MKAVQTIALVLVAMAALSAVASAYDPLADNKVPSPKSPIKPNPTLASRKLLQNAAMTVSGNSMTNTDKPGLLWGGYVIATPYWVEGMQPAMRRAGSVDTQDAANQRFARLGSGSK